MRLIDADALLTKKFITDDIDSYDTIPVDEIVDAPTIDAVEVVRCEDCKYWHEKNSNFSIRNGVCERIKCSSSCISYCSCGERKIDAEVEG